MSLALRKPPLTAAERSRRYRQRHPERLQAYEQAHPERAAFRVTYLQNRRERGRQARARHCPYLGCDEIRYSRRQLQIHLHRDHGLKRILTCQRCGIVTARLKHKPRRVRVVKPRIVKPKLTRLQKLQLKGDREITIRVRLRIPDREGYTMGAKYAITKTMSEWLRLAEKPPKDLPLKDNFNIALLTAVVLFKERFKLA